MDEFIILRRIAKTSEEYILQVLELTSSQRVPILYNRSTEEISILYQISDDYYDRILETFTHYETSGPLEDDFLKEALKIDKIDISSFKIHRFDRKTRPALRRFNYSFKNGRSLFIPCCGKHVDHENIKSLWGKYINTFELTLNVIIEGYQVNDVKAFDEYITHLNPSILGMRFIGNPGILLKEFLDYIDSCIPLDEAESQANPEIIIKYPTGKEIKLDRNVEF